MNVFTFIFIHACKSIFISLYNCVPPSLSSHCLFFILIYLHWPHDISLPLRDQRWWMQEKREKNCGREKMKEKWFDRVDGIIIMELMELMELMKPSLWKTAELKLRKFFCLSHANFPQTSKWRQHFFLFFFIFFYPFFFFSFFSLCGKMSQMQSTKRQLWYQMEG